MPNVGKSETVPANPALGFTVTSGRKTGAVLSLALIVFQLMPSIRTSAIASPGSSANWDARSLRLNFEFNIECYNRALAASLESGLEKSFAVAERVTLAKLNERPFLAKFRDAVARLAMPYL
jgi:hypothetical protein